MFQSAWTRRRYWGIFAWGPSIPIDTSFNPLGRGVGIGGGARRVFILGHHLFQSAWTRRRYWGQARWKYMSYVTGFNPLGRGVGIGGGQQGIQGETGLVSIRLDAA